MARCTFYAQLKPELSRSGERWYVRALRFARATSRYPRDPVGGAIIVEISVEIPDEALKPLRPKVVVEVPIEQLDVVVRSTPVPVASNG